MADEDAHSEHECGGRMAGDTPSPAATTHRGQAEWVHVDERLVISPLNGLFFPAYTEVRDAAVTVGDEIGVVVRNGEKHPVHSPFTGELLGMLAAPGERVRAHQPVAWLTTADGL
jgi:biotin carboxyl carrier protein